MSDNEDFWEDLLSHIRHKALVPVVGPELSVVSVGDTEQTLTTLIGQRLAERFQLKVSPGNLTMDERSRRSCRSAAEMSSNGCIGSFTTPSQNWIRRLARHSVTSPRSTTCASL